MPSGDQRKQFITGDLVAAKSAMAGLIAEPVDSLAKWISVYNDYPVPDTTGWAIMLTHKINDTLTAPAWLYIPSKYDSHQPAPLMVNLHGGVSGPKFRDAGAKNWLEEPEIQIAEREGWLYLYPLGMTGCAWWDSTGMQNILWFVRDVKRQFNIDDDYVGMSGFSDGGSGSFQFGMLAPTEFSSFYPWSGHPAVGTLVGGVSAYLPSLSARPLFVTNGGRDQLYPAAAMERIHRLAFEAGSPFSTAYYDTAGHNWEYMTPEMEAWADRFEGHGRDAYPPTIRFETADLNFATSDWITITDIDTTRIAAEWHKDYNLTQTDDRLTIGFNPDMEYKGKGVRVASVARDLESPAALIGMKEGDVITEIDGLKIIGMPDIVKAKEGRKRGDPIKITYKRGRKTLKGESNYPPVREYPIFPRTSKSGAIQAKRLGNTFEIETSRVSGLRLALCPRLTKFDQPVNVVINGVEVLNAIVTPSSETLLTGFINSHDRKRLTWANLDFTIPVQ